MQKDGSTVKWHSLHTHRETAMFSMEHSLHVHNQHARRCNPPDHCCDAAHVRNVRQLPDQGTLLAAVVEPPARSGIKLWECHLCWQRC